MPILGERSRPDPQRSLVGFVVGDVQYAIEIGRVREIVNPLPVTPLPHTPAEVLGVADHRGDVVPVILLRLRFGLHEIEPTRSTKWILVDAGTHTVGLVVDSVTEVFRVNGPLRPTPAVGGDRDLRGISGVTNHNDQLVFVLDEHRFVEMALALAASGVLPEGS
ncbi:chemotaxis protein CheW [Chondromyces crocatus]|uniref:Chemotaxis protein CheW n=1 Tax=Chondromyces crocatus TaxID=52 RepID=A0A0K1EN97_CHOCO|nr:chemotaxis protein CheW [Chondromyces crocatus]AKT42405.1 chemotaxis protein CheW [Chondromyces crocatus]